MRALYLKELRTLLPLHILMILSNSGDVLYRPFTERLDEAAWTDISSYITPGANGDYGLSLLIFGLLVAYSLFPREHDEGTIEFLYSLPVTRWRIFAAKTLAGMTVLVSSCVLLQLTDGLLQSFNPQSLEGEQWQLRTSALAGLLHSLFACFILCHGLLISFFRRFGLIPYALGWWILFSLERISPVFSWLDPTKLLSLQYQGQRLVVPWGEVAFHTVVALLTMVVAALLWTGRAEQFFSGPIFTRLGRATRGRAALGCGTTLIVVAVLGALITLSGPLEIADDVEQEPRFTVVSAQTRWFDVTYPSNVRGRALALIRDLDELHELTRTRLGVEAGERIALDLTDQSAHHEGITAWTKMRVGLLGEPDDRRLRRTFVHELVHAFQFQESKRGLVDNARATYFFGEGSAEYISFEIVPDAQLRRGSRRVTLLAWQRNRLRFEELAAQQRLGQRLDPHLVYAAGESWTAALVRACGEDAIGAVLRAMGRDGAPQDLAPEPFWRDTLQASGCDLEAVQAEWARMMSEGEERERAFLAAVPRLGGGVAGRGEGTLELLATLDRESLSQEEFSELTYLVRVRQDPSVDDTQLRVFEGELEQVEGRWRVSFDVPTSVLRGRRFQFQFGQRFRAQGWPHFEPWQWADLP